MQDGAPAGDARDCPIATALGPSGWGSCWENSVRGRSGLVIERALGNRRVRYRWMSTSENRTLRESWGSKGCWEYPVQPIPEGGQRGRTVESRPPAHQGRAGEDMASSPLSTLGPEWGQDRPWQELRAGGRRGDAWGPRRLATGFPRPWRAPCSGRCPLLTLATSTFHCCSA